jgi:hypothetical protein
MHIVAFHSAFPLKPPIHFECRVPAIILAVNLFSGDHTNGKAKNRYEKYFCNGPAPLDCFQALDGADAARKTY